MAVHLQVRDVPDRLHQTLVERSRERGLSLRQYTLEVLADHCAQPTMREWLAEVAELTAVSLPEPAAAAVSQAREEDDAEVLRGRLRG